MTRAADRPRARVHVRCHTAEAAIAVLAFGVAAFAAFGPHAALRGTPTAASILIFTGLVGGYLAFSVGAVVRALDDVVRRRRARALAGTGILWLAVILYAALTGLSVLPRAAAFALYLAAPALLATGGPAQPGKLPARELAAVALLWLPIEFGLLPPLPVPAPAGYDASRFVALVAGLFLFLVARPVPRIGYTFALRPRDVSIAVATFVAYAVVALPLGLATGFLAWQPRVTVTRVVVTPLVIYLATGVPEEFLFRGLIQNLLARWWRPAAALPVAAVVFGLAHLPDPRYVALATLAGLAYGWVYHRTGRITAAAVTHALVDAVWVVLLHR